MSYDRAIFVDQTTDASLSSDTVLTEIDRWGSGFSGAALCRERCGRC